MSPSTWVRANPGTALSVIVALLSIGAAVLLPIADVAMLGSENVIEILGIILAGQLVVLALTAPAVLETRATVLDGQYAAELLDPVDHIAQELKSNTLCCFVMFGIAFAASTVLEGMPDVLDMKILNGPDVDALFASVKITFVALSLFAMWDSVEPLFALGDAMSLLRRIEEQSETRDIDDLFK